VESPDALREFALELVAETDPIALRSFSGGLEVRAKPDRTLVTQADTEVEARLRDRISAAFPGHGILGEELGDAPGSGSVRWVIDPIDGTHNFVRGIPVWATLVAVERDGEVIAAVASAPALGVRWHAALGHGAARRDRDGVDRVLNVSAVAGLDEAQLVYSSLRAMERAGHAAALRRAVDGAWRDRGFGDFWGYMLVAQGSAEVMVETGVSAWDLAAPSLIVTEAGGRFSRIDGTPGHDGPDALATNGLLHDELLRRFAARPPRPA
jgi:histidinol-phosphatase